MSEKSTSCPCGSGLPLLLCCGRYLFLNQAAETAEQVMRARFTAYVLRETNFLLSTWDDSTRPERRALEQDQNITWQGLQIRSCEKGGNDDDSGIVEFIARGHASGQAITLHETSRFKRRNGSWVYVDGDIHPLPDPNRKVSRNALCPCGSGKKYKRCCGA
jgi:SEC-C motif domain protein